MATPGYGAYDSDVADIERRQRYAELLRQQSMSPIPQQMAGRVAVRTSPLEALAKGLQGFGAQRQIGEIGNERKALASRMETERGADMTAMVNALRGTPARPSAVDPQEIEQNADQGTPLPPMIPGTPGDPNAAAMAALQSKFGDIRGMAPAMLAMGEARQTREDNQAFRAQEAQAAREARKQELELRLQDARTTSADRIAMQRELAKMADDTKRFVAEQSAAARRDAAADRNKPPAGFRFTQNGDLERIPGGPADIKAEAELQKKSAGAGDVDVALGTLRDAYNRLETGGGITSTKNSALGNVAPSVASSGVGQAAGKLFGTNNQSARNDIAMARPALLAALMKATGMSAKQMDSNAELKLWLSTATDPTLDVESNRRALDNIEKKYISPQNRRATDKPGASGGWKDL